MKEIQWISNVNVNNQTNFFTKYIVLALKGTLIGFGAIIIAGICEKTLCVAFGMCYILLNALSYPGRIEIREKFFLLDTAIGFIELTGTTEWLMKINAHAINKRNGKSYATLQIGFIMMITTLILMAFWKFNDPIAQNKQFSLLRYCLRNQLFRPGLSSSTLLYFFGLYPPLLEDIVHDSLFHFYFPCRLLLLSV